VHAHPPHISQKSHYTSSIIPLLQVPINCALSDALHNTCSPPIIAALYRDCSESAVQFVAGGKKSIGTISAGSCTYVPSRKVRKTSSHVIRIIGRSPRGSRKNLRRANRACALSSTALCSQSRMKTPNVSDQADAPSYLNVREM
jgi:hypothetical protein